MTESANAYLEDGIDHRQIIEKQARNDEPVVQGRLEVLQSPRPEAGDDGEGREDGEDDADGDCGAGSLGGKRSRWLGSLHCFSLR